MYIYVYITCTSIYPISIYPFLSLAKFVFSRNLRIPPGLGVSYAITRVCLNAWICTHESFTYAWIRTHVSFTYAQIKHRVLTQDAFFCVHMHLVAYTNIDIPISPITCQRQNDVFEPFDVKCRPERVS